MKIFHRTATRPRRQPGRAGPPVAPARLPRAGRRRAGRHRCPWDRSIASRRPTPHRPRVGPLPGSRGIHQVEPPFGALPPERDYHRLSTEPAARSPRARVRPGYVVALGWCWRASPGGCRGARRIRWRRATRSRAVRRVGGGCRGPPRLLAARSGAPRAAGRWRRGLGRWMSGNRSVRPTAGCEDRPNHWQPVVTARLSTSCRRRRSRRSSTAPQRQHW